MPKDKKFAELEAEGFIGIKEATTFIGVAHSIYTRQLLLEGYSLLKVLLEESREDSL